jgi:hypothetical protein
MMKAARAYYAALEEAKGAKGKRLGELKPPAGSGHRACGLKRFRRPPRRARV